MKFYAESMAEGIQDPGPERVLPAADNISAQGSVTPEAQTQQSAPAPGRWGFLRKSRRSEPERAQVAQPAIPVPAVASIEAVGNSSGGFRAGSPQARLEQIWSDRKALKSIPAGPERQKRAAEIDSAFTALRAEVGLDAFMPLQRTAFEQFERERVTAEAKQAKLQAQQYSESNVSLDNFFEGSPQVRLRQLWSARKVLPDIPKGPRRQKRADEINTAFKALKDEVGVVPFLPIDRSMYEQLDREWAAAEAKRAKQAQESQNPPKKQGFFSKFLDRIAQPESSVVGAVNITARTFDPIARKVDEITEPKVQVTSQGEPDESSERQEVQPSELSPQSSNVVEAQVEYKPKPGGNLETLSPEEQEAIIRTYKDRNKLSALDSLDGEAFQGWFQKWVLKVEEYKRLKATKET